MQVALTRLTVPESFFFWTPRRGEIAAWPRETARSARQARLPRSVSFFLLLCSLSSSLSRPLPLAGPMQGRSCKSRLFFSILCTYVRCNNPSPGIPRGLVGRIVHICTHRIHPPTHIPTRCHCADRQTRRSGGQAFSSLLISRFQWAPAAHQTIIQSVRAAWALDWSECRT